MVDVAFNLVYFFEYAQAALDDGADFQADAPRQRAPQGRTGLHQRARARDLEAHQRFTAAGSVPGRNLLLGHAKTAHLVLRQVDALFTPVDIDVLPEIDQLKAAADRVRMLQIFFACGAE